MRTPSRRSSRPASALAESDWTRNDAGASPLPHRAERKHHAGVVHQEPPHPSGPLRRVQQSHGPTPTRQAIAEQTSRIPHNAIALLAITARLPPADVAFDATSPAPTRISTGVTVRPSPSRRSPSRRAGSSTGQSRCWRSRRDSRRLTWLVSPPVLSQVADRAEQLHVAAPLAAQSAVVAVVDREHARGLALHRHRRRVAGVEHQRAAAPLAAAI